MPGPPASGPPFPAWPPPIPAGAPPIPTGPPPFAAGPEPVTAPPFAAGPPVSGVEPVTAPPFAAGQPYQVVPPGFENQPPPAYEPGYASYQPQPSYDPNNPAYQSAPAFVPAEVYGPALSPPQAAPRRRWWVPVLIAVVLLLAIGAIATVGLVDQNGDDTANPTPTPTPTAVTSTPARPSPSAPATSSSAPPAGLVTTDPSVTDSRAADVAALFEDYFTAINNRDYDQALAAYDPAGVINPGNAKQAADFKQAISTTTDSQIVLRSVGPPASGRGVLDARVTFVSNQQPGYGPRERPGETCTAWDVTYAISQPAGAYKIVIGKATSSAC